MCDYFCGRIFDDSQMIGDFIMMISHFDNDDIFFVLNQIIGQPGMKCKMEGRQLNGEEMVSFAIFLFLIESKL